MLHSSPYGNHGSQDYEFEYEDDDQETGEADVENKVSSCLRQCPKHPTDTITVLHGQRWTARARSVHPPSSSCSQLYATTTRKEPSKSSRVSSKRRKRLATGTLLVSWPLGEFIIRRTGDSKRSNSSQSSPLDASNSMDRSSTICNSFPSPKRPLLESAPHFVPALARAAGQRAYSTAEKAINGILDYVSASTEIETALMQRFYEETLKSLSEAKNDVRCPSGVLACLSCLVYMHSD